jgi:hypothetical protein
MPSQLFAEGRRHRDDDVGAKIRPFGVGFMQVQAPRKKKLWTLMSFAK